MPPAKAAKAVTPPMTPPTIGPTGVECEGDFVSCGFAESVEVPEVD